MYLQLKEIVTVKFSRKSTVLVEVYLSPVGIYLLKVNNRNTRTKCKICSKFTIRTAERRQAYFTPYSSVSIVNFEHVIADWE